MNSERWQKVKKILEDALETAPASRLALIENCCGGDLELRREVEQLLKFETADEDLLEQNVFDAILPEIIEAKSLRGRQIGNYRIVEKIGAGGMGAVYLAENVDDSFEQKVALKLIRPELVSSAVLRRFYNERQILAALEHPNIAHLIGGGATENDLPYLVMEYVAGETISRYAARRKSDD